MGAPKTARSAQATIAARFSAPPSVQSVAHSIKAEEETREQIDRLLAAAGWLVRNVAQANLHASQGVAICEFKLDSGFGHADHLPNSDGTAA